MLKFKKIPAKKIEILEAEHEEFYGKVAKLIASK